MTNDEGMTKAKSKCVCVAILAAALAPGLAFANMAPFEGMGQTVRLVSSSDVQLQSEEVIIVPGRGPFMLGGEPEGVGRFWLHGALPGWDLVDYRCKFVLRNRTKKPVTIQVGFPLADSGEEGCDWSGIDVTELVLCYRFIVRDKERTYHVRYVPFDDKRRLQSIFLWDMTLQGDEVRELHVAYERPMRISPMPSIKRNLEANPEQENKPSHDGRKSWYSYFETNLGEWFWYVTETGRSWAGPIEHAKFEVYVGAFERYLDQRDVGKDQEKPKSKELMQSNRSLEVRTGDMLVHREILPGGWKEKDRVITWEYKDYRPSKGITIGYSLYVLPKTPEAVPKFVGSVLGDKPSKEDLGDLREIYMAWWGIAPKSKSVRQLVSNLRWYTPKDGMTADKLTAEQKAVVAALERCAAKAEDDKKR
jgi:hypothetical protein